MFRRPTRRAICFDCHGKLPRWARRCPHCGANQRKQRAERETTWKKQVLLVILCVIYFGLMVTYSDELLWLLGD